jgi:ATP diphosphatase
MFVMANLARHMKIDPEQSLRDANHKFHRRFNSIEDKLHAKGSAPARSNLAEMDALWDEVKREENILVKDSGIDLTKTLRY